MATTKLWKVVKRMDHVIDYETNKEKTKAIDVKDNYEMVVEKHTCVVLADDTYMFHFCFEILLFS